MKWAGSKIILNLSFPPFSLHFINFSPTKQRKILILPYISLSLFPFLPSSLQPNIVFISFYILLIFLLSPFVSFSPSLHATLSSLPPILPPFICQFLSLPSRNLVFTTTLIAKRKIKNEKIKLK